MDTLIKTDIPGYKKFFMGKVRDIYRIDAEHFLFASTDRFSAFDYVFPNGIPGKGVILNKISNMWFSNIKFVKNHIVETDFANFPKPFSDFPEQFKDRSVIARRAKRIDFECIVRGYLLGSGWKDYCNTGEICGIKIQEGLKFAQELPFPIFTPATKAKDGHDINISIEVMRKKLGADVTERLGELTLQIYEFAREKMKTADIILADTKFEFGFIGNEIILIDEVLTPDSSRFWDRAQYRVEESPVSFDKQFIRDYLETTTWDKSSPPPALPDDIIFKTKKKYEEILNRISAVLATE